MKDDKRRWLANGGGCFISFSCKKPKLQVECEGKDFTLTLTLTLFMTDYQPVKGKSEGVRVKKEKKFFIFSSVL